SVSINTEEVSMACFLCQMSRLITAFLCTPYFHATSKVVTINFTQKRIFETFVVYINMQG
ncbi:unnamed protein product, partial [marine sediment metagenome]